MADCSCQARENFPSLGQTFARKHFKATKKREDGIVRVDVRIERFQRPAALVRESSSETNRIKLHKFAGTKNSRGFLTLSKEQDRCPDALPRRHHGLQSKQP
jgi:hypothetical protein